MPVIEKYVVKDLDGKILNEHASRIALEKFLQNHSDHVLIEKHVCNISFLGVYSPKKKGFSVSME